MASSSKAFRRLVDRVAAFGRNLGFKRHGLHLNRSVCGGIVHVISASFASARRSPPGSIPEQEYLEDGFAVITVGVVLEQMIRLDHAVLCRQSFDSTAITTPERGYYRESACTFRTWLVQGPEADPYLRPSDCAAEDRDGISEELRDQIVEFFDNHASNERIVARIDAGSPVSGQDDGYALLVAAAISASLGQKERSMEFLHRSDAAPGLTHYWPTRLREAATALGIELT